MVKPRAQHSSAVTSGISRDKNQFDLIRQIRRHVPKGGTDIRHVEWAHIWTAGVSEKEERNVSVGLQSEIERIARCGAQSKPRLRQGRGDQSSPVCRGAVFWSLGRRAVTRPKRKGENNGACAEESRFHLE